MPMKTRWFDRLEPAEVEHLVEDLRGAQVAAEAHRAGRAEGARERAARLRGDADRAAAVAVAHQHRLDRVAVGGAEERLHRAVARRAPRSRPSASRTARSSASSPPERARAGSSSPRTRRRRAPSTPTPGGRGRRARRDRRGSARGARGPRGQGSPVLAQEPCELLVPARLAVCSGRCRRSRSGSDPAPLEQDPCRLDVPDEEQPSRADARPAYDASARRSSGAPRSTSSRTVSAPPAKQAEMERR